MGKEPRTKEYPKGLTKAGREVHDGKEMLIAAKEQLQFLQAFANTKRPRDRKNAISKLRLIGRKIGAHRAEHDEAEGLDDSLFECADMQDCVDATVLSMRTDFEAFLTDDSLSDIGKRWITQQMDEPDSGVREKVLSLAYKAASCSTVNIKVMLMFCGLSDCSPCLLQLHASKPKPTQWVVCQAEKTIMLGIAETVFKATTAEVIVSATQEFESNAKFPDVRLDDLDPRSEDLIKGWAPQVLIDGKLFVAIGSLVAKRTLNPSEKFTIAELVKNEAKVSVRLRSYFKNINGINNSVCKKAYDQMKSIAEEVAHGGCAKDRQKDVLAMIEPLHSAFNEYDADTEGYGEKTTQVYEAVCDLVDNHASDVEQFGSFFDHVPEYTGTVDIGFPETAAAKVATTLMGASCCIVKAFDGFSLNFQLAILNKPAAIKEDSEEEEAETGLDSIPDAIEALLLLSKICGMLARYSGSSHELVMEAKHRSRLHYDLYIARSKRGNARMRVATWCDFWERHSKPFKPVQLTTLEHTSALQDFVTSSIATDVVEKAMVSEIERAVTASKKDRDALIIEATQHLDMLPTSAAKLVHVAKDIQDMLNVAQQIDAGKMCSGLTPQPSSRNQRKSRPRCRMCR